jgi:nucleoside-diphosphate-sugar epimerase
MNVIVTGAAGFVASHVVDALLARGDRVYAIDSFVTGSSSNLEMASRHSEFSLLTADLTSDAEKILGWLHEQGTRYEAILHMASPARLQAAPRRDAGG